MKQYLIFLFLLVTTGLWGQVRINELPAKTNADSTWLILTGNPNTGRLYKMTFDHLKDSIIGITSSGGGGTWGSITGTLSSQTDLQSALDGKQATLVSGTNIKTINSTSLLGAGNITVTAAAAGSNTQVQFNSSGALGASANFIWNGTQLSLGGNPSPYGLFDVYQNSVDGANNIALWNAGAVGPFGGGFVTLAMYGSNAYGIPALENTFLFESVANGGIGLNAYAGTIKLMIGTGRTIVAQVKSTGLNITAQVYADDAAAGAGGLVAGDIYQTSAGVLMIKQ